MKRARRHPDGGSSARVRLPHPRGLSRSLGRIRRFRGWPSVLALVGAGATLSAATAFGGVGLVVGTLATLGLVLGTWGRGRSLEAVVDDEVLRLPALGLTLPRGKGDLVVQAVERQGKNGILYRWDLSHTQGGLIASDCAHPLVVRACAEGLALAGEWPLVWRSPAIELERRRPTELDVPLSVREAREPMIPRERYRPLLAHYDAVVHPRDPTGIRLLFVGGLRGRIQTDAFSQIVAVGIATVPLAVVFGWWTLPVVLLPALVFAPLATPDVEVTRGGVVLRYHLLGGLPVFRRRLPASEIESLYVETEPGKRVIAVGDRSRVTIAQVHDGFEAAWLRSTVVRALIGEQGILATPEEQPHTAVGSTSPPADDDGSGRCPNCMHVGLERIGGPLEEHGCPICGGRFLPQGGAERLVEDELGITRDMLRELTRYFGGERRTCPSCRSGTSAVRLKGVTADLCQGCGGLWLDAGELGQLSQGRYEG